MRRVLLALLSIAIGIPAGAGTISFDEFPPANSHWIPLRDEYAHMGVEFLEARGVAVWSGMSTQDRDYGWDLEGTNGSAFLGFRAGSDPLIMLLNEAVEGFRLDVARAAGSSAGAHFTLVGFHNGEWVEEAYIDLGASGINEWSTAELLHPVDEVQMLGTGEGWQPFGVDNVQWGGEGGGSAMQVDVEVRPGNSNVLNPFSRGVVPVVIYGSESFDVMDVEPESVGFGPNAAPIFGGKQAHLADVDGDGYDDLFCHFPVPETGIAFGDEEACVSGETLDGVALEGCAPVVTVPDEKLEEKREKRNRR
jgi:hypothetical protein